MQFFGRREILAPLTRARRPDITRTLYSGVALAVLTVACGDRARSTEVLDGGGAARDAAATREYDATRDGGARRDGGLVHDGGARGDAAPAGDAGGARDGGEEHDDASLPARVPAWEAPQIIAETRVSYFVRAQVNASTDAVIVWDDLEGEVRSKLYDGESASWSAPVMLDPENPEDSALPSVAGDAEGNVLAVWQRQSQESDERSVWASRYDVRQGNWSPATRIANSELVLAPDVVVDGAGNGVLVFTVAKLDTSGAYARFDASMRTWSAAEPVSRDGLLFAAPRIAMLPEGRAVSLWTVGTYERGDIWAADYDTRLGNWTNFKKLTSAPAPVLATSVAVNANGEAVGVWTRQEGDTLVVWASVRNREGVWLNPERIDRTDGGSALLPQVAIDERGDIVCLWSADDGTRQSVWMNRYVASRGAFQGAERVDAPLHGHAMAPLLGIDGQGNAFALWLRDEASARSVWAARLQASAPAFEPARELRSSLGGDASNIELAVTHDGRALALWSEAGERLVASWYR